MGIFKKKNDEELAAVYREKGFYSEEYIQVFRSRHPKMNSDDHCTLCEIYAEMGRFEDARNELFAVRPGMILDDITTGQQLYCHILLSMCSGRYKDAYSTFRDNARFLDRFMSNPVRSRIAGDYYSSVASLIALFSGKSTVSATSGSETGVNALAEAENSSDSSSEKASSSDNSASSSKGFAAAFFGSTKKGDAASEVRKYMARLREWCDIFPKHRILLDITEVALLFAQNKEEAEDAAAKCRTNILDFSGFEYEWQRDYFLKKLDRATRLMLSE